MDPLPRVVGLIACNQVIVDDNTRQPSLISIFTGLLGENFPTRPNRFVVYATLTGGVGEGRIQLKVIRMATDRSIYSQRGSVSFPDRTDPVNVFFHVTGIRFPAPGYYLLQLLIDGELIEHAQRPIAVSQLGNRNEY